MRPIILNAAFALSLLGSLAVGGAARAAPVVFSDSPYGQARPVVNVVFADYIKGLTGVQIQTAIVDVDSDGKGEILARFLHSSSCYQGMKSCRTVLLRYQGGNWKIVIDRFAAAVDVSKGYRDVPAPVKVDATTWNWDGKRYVPDLATLGDASEFKPVSDATRQTLSAAFGPAADKLAKAGYPIRYSYIQDGLSKNNDLLLVKMEGNLVCGKITGCPVRVLRMNADKKWATVVATATTGDVRIAKAARDGYRDVVMQTRDGALQLGWTGSAYAVADRIEGVAQ